MSIYLWLASLSLSFGQPISVVPPKEAIPKKRKPPAGWRKFWYPNFHKTYGNNYRSGTPTSYAVLKYLRDEFGIKRVVNLALDSMRYQQDKKFKCRGYHRRSQQCEPKWAKSLGLEYIPAYMTSRAPSKEKWNRIRAALEKGNTLVHCTYGADRTGAVVARFALETIEDVSAKELYREAVKYGFKRSTFRGYRKGKADPNRRLRKWMLAGSFQGVPKQN